MHDGSSDHAEPGRTVGLRVAVDCGPLHGPRTGVGNAVAWLLDELATRRSVELHRYVISARARVRPPEHRFALPAAVAHRLWQRPSPPLDRFLGRPDLVHGTNYILPPTRCASVVSVYDCWFLDHPDDATPDGRRWADVLRHAVAGGAHVVTSSLASARTLRDTLDTDRVTTILLGPPPPPPSEVAPAATLDALPPSLADEAHPFLVSLGTIERRKNIPGLVAAFGRVALEHERVRLVIAGMSGNDSGAVHRAISRLPADVATRIVQLGPVDAPTKHWLLAHARALAYPSLDEGFGFPILEAHQHDLPVVASAAGSIPEISANASLLSAPGDVDALAANLYWVLTNDDIRDKLVARGRRNLARFSWVSTTDQLIDLYRSIAEAPR